MAYDKTASRPAVNLSLNEDLLIRAKAATSNLSATVEDPLARFVQEDQARKRAEDQQLAAVITAVNAVHAEHVYLSDEFPSL
ncbi:type II toxin-antitoxin system CcdA family antitoxin [Lichenicola cladoniae]|nr:type II toxin-antitoxin system CcdA family antitoxin [Lichenicola cladoniae]